MAAVAGIKSASAELVAATADTVTLSAGARKRGRIVNHGCELDGITTSPAPIFFRGDGTAATVGGEECRVVAAGEEAHFIFGDSGVMSVISAGTPAYTVEAHA